MSFARLSKFYTFGVVIELVGMKGRRDRPTRLSRSKAFAFSIPGRHTQKARMGSGVDGKTNQEDSKPT